MHVEAYTAIIFDLDGTVSDSSKGITGSVQFALEKLGLPVPPAEELLWTIGPPIFGNFSKLLGTDDRDAVENAIAIFRERYGPWGIFQATLYPGMKELLERLKEDGRTLLIATSKALPYTEKVLQHHELAGLFSGVFGPPLGGTSIKKADSVAAAIRSCPDLTKGHFVMVGDTASDILAARANGIDSIAVTYGYGSLEELRAAGPTYVAGSVQDLGRLLCPA